MVAKLNIVVVEDNDDLRDLTCQVLMQEGHRVTGLSCAEDLEDLVGGESFDVFLLDINLPGEDGISLSQRIRKAHPLVGIIMLSARTDLRDKISGYESGADLYMAKPVGLPELTAAIRSFARRRHAEEKDIKQKNLTLVLSKMVIVGSDGSIKLSPSEATLVTAFARAPSGKLENWQIAEIFNIHVDEDLKRTIKVRMARLRKKLEDAGAEGVVIESIRNIGYQLLSFVEVV